MKGKLPKCFGTYLDDPRPWHCKGVTCPVFFECREYARNGLNRHYNVAKAWWIFSSTAFTLAVWRTINFINTKDPYSLFASVFGYSATIPFFIYFLNKKRAIFKKAKRKMLNEELKKTTKALKFS